jgi:hypothetical protein
VGKLNRSLLTTLVIALLIIGGGIAYYVFIKAENSNPIGGNDTPAADNTGSIVLEKEGFTLSADYVGDNTWEYSIAGTLPTPCHEYTISPVVMESYPEQVVININISVDPEIMCIQVIQDVQELGTFNASDSAKIDLSVKTNPQE